MFARTTAPTGLKSVSEPLCGPISPLMMVSSDAGRLNCSAAASSSCLAAAVAAFFTALPAT
ncbi:hypothetical protein D3C83_12860 [compost metagenome]